MKRPVKLNFGERMREWRKARKSYVDEVKKKVQEQKNIEDTYPKLTVPLESKTVSLSPEKETEAKQPEIRYIERPNHIEAAINHLRERAQGL